MTSLEYLCINVEDELFNFYSFVQFPPNLKYLALYNVRNAAKILSWVAKGCKDLIGLRLDCELTANGFQAISRMKSLKYLDVPMSYDIGYVFEELTELRAIKIDTVNEMVVIVTSLQVIDAIKRYCNNLEHLNISGNRSDKISAEIHANLLQLASLPCLCSLSIWASSYSKEQTTEFVNRLVANGNIQYIQMATSKVPLEPEVLFEMLRRCKVDILIAY
ncbi:hypothetical protein DdX_15577 [Ditylenchus destructor]|uniref:Uncharacterized protein n=1 Tax=Ditylenchus destructor TaxID=166010 RepID=A0AAD4MSJ6_9BILA|nr:hypothetical protein DdX_15577 [Ditylenchus destructor]